MELTEARTYCRTLTRRTAKNFYYAFLFLPKADQQAAFALYAFCRQADDLVDDDRPDHATRLEALERYGQLLDACLRGERPEHPIFMALSEVISRYPVPGEAMRMLLEGMRDDLTITRYRTFAELEAYCYKVASTVAMMLVPIFDPPRTEALMPYARAGGIAVQLTNILRDIREDGARGRIYLPQEDLDRFGVTEAALLEGQLDDRFRELMAFQVRRAQEFYRQAEALLTSRDRRRQGVLETARLIYLRVLDEIVQHRYDVFSSRISVSTPRKMGISIESRLKSLMPTS